PQLLERFHAEVRNARQVSHPNVCRVYDVGEWQGHQFLTMEFIDGEDLASLLRRIGRVPPDKALEIARQLCAGLAAAHDKGVLHRDLKPANIMIDGRGKARITDFGLAVTTTESSGEFAGTPAYMSPEQLAGQPATQQSDIYSLGLVLHELCTGKRVFEGASLAELRRSRTQSKPRLPSSSGDMDPAVERAILRCLAEDPKQRPASAVQLAAALPGGDPLMAAIAAGETPSPELIAAAGGEDAGITPHAAAAALLVIVVGLALLVPLSRRASVFGMAPNVKSPEALADRAQEIAKSLGHTEAPRDRAWMMLPSAQLRYSALHEPSPARYRNLATAEPGPHRFAYLQSPESLSPPSPLGGVNPSSHPRDTSGMIAMGLDGHGHLVTFTALPPVVAPETRPGEMDWTPLLSHTSLDIAKLKPVPPTELFPFAHDQRAEWTGTWEGSPVQVSAASLGGRPVSLRITGIWAQRGNWVAPNRSREWIVIAFVFVVFGVGPLMAGMMARRNLKLGRSDPRGALRLATFVGGCTAIALLSVGGYQLEARLVAQIASRLGIAVLSASVVWVSYLALEPLVRRRTPELLVSWMRLLDGRWQDPRVGRDVLIGLCVGTVLPVVAYFLVALPWWINAPGVIPLHQLFAINDWATTALLLIGSTPLSSLAVLFLLALIQGIFNRSWVLLLAIFVINLAGVVVDQHLNLPSMLLYSTVSSIATFLLITRIGPLSLSVATMAALLLWTTPLDFHSNAWYWPQSAAIVALLLGLAIFSFRNALAGRKLFDTLLED
ncbi:MAG: serine/threonine-protein kinase, partial [Terriglobales bacterium]